MAVKEFISVRDVKQTVEKEVKRKPSVSELTKIETPGRPMPAQGLVEEPRKKRSFVRKDGKEPSAVEFVGDAIFVITEKPQAALKIANALGSARKYSEGGASYYEVSRGDKKILVGSAVGHLFNLEYKEGQRGWPIFEIEWKPSYQRKGSEFTKKFFYLLKKLAKQAGEIMIATDYDIEGEVIGWNILRFICNREDAKRMKFSTLTKDELIQSFEKPMKTLDWGQAYAGEARHTLDWLYGINLSRALMSAIKTAGSFKLLSIGRVQGPALKIIVEREKEIANFKPRPFWNVFAYVDNFAFKHDKDIFDKNELAKFNSVKEGNALTTEKEEKIIPGAPFDLTTLQREAYRVHKIGPSQTLAIAQKLYLDGLISYPRTSSEKIPSAIQPKKILKLLEKVFPEAVNAKRAKPIEGKKSDPAHPAIYPTGEFSKLEGDEFRVYSLIARRFIGIFSDDARILNKKVIIETGAGNFKASGLKVLEKGWTSVYPTILEEKDAPTLDGKVKIDKIENVEKETQPPKRYTPTGLVSTLEKKNLGTKATRSTIVDTLFGRGYLDGRSIQATPLGMQLIESLEKFSPIIIDENLTRQLEEEIEKIQGDGKKGIEKLKFEEEEVVKKARRMINDISKEFKAHEIDIGMEILKGIKDLREQERESNTLMSCKTCGKGELRIMYSPKTKRSFIGCSAYPSCTQTYSLPPHGFMKKAGKECEDCGFQKVMAIRKGKRPWEFCFNPECESNKERVEKYRERQKEENEENNK